MPQDAQRGGATSRRACVQPVERAQGSIDNPDPFVSQHAEHKCICPFTGQELILEMMTQPAV